MKVDEQGVRSARKHQVIPRTLVLLTSDDPDTGQREILLIKGAPTKRLWPNRYNGLGGHVEAHEDILQAAQREVQEEAGLFIPTLALRGVIHINTGRDTGKDSEGARPGVLVFVFVGHTQERSVQAGDEGEPAWLPLEHLDDYPLVDDLYALIPLALDDGPPFYGHYYPRSDGSMAYSFR